MIPRIVIGELWHGFLLGGKYQQNAELLHEFLSENCVQVPEVGAETAKHYAMLLSHLHKQGTPIPTNDI